MNDKHNGPVDINETLAWGVTGTQDMIEQGVFALTQLKQTLPEDQELAELRVYENTPIEALVMDEYGVLTLLRWNRKRWVEILGNPWGMPS